MLLVSITPRQDAKAEPVDPHCPNRLPYIGGSMHIPRFQNQHIIWLVDAGGISYYFPYDVPMFQWFSKFSDMSGQVKILQQPKVRAILGVGTPNNVATRGHPGHFLISLQKIRMIIHTVTISNLLTKYTQNISKSQHEGTNFPWEK